MRVPKILLVEDEMAIAFMIEIMLDDLGYEVLGPLATISQAMNLIETAEIDAVILDVNLNGEMSYPVADELIARRVPFLFSTAYRQERLPEAYQGVPVLQKPYHPSALGNILARLLARSPAVDTEER